MTSGVDGSAMFAHGKNKRMLRKKLSRKSFDFLYDREKGGLYFNDNGLDTGFGDGGILLSSKVLLI